MPDVEVVEEKCMNSEKSFRGHTDLNHGPIGLQPIALPLSYIPTWWQSVQKRKAGSHDVMISESSSGKKIIWSCEIKSATIFWSACKRRWYNGQHSCLPSSWSGFDSRPTHNFLSFDSVLTFKICILQTNEDGIHQKEHWGHCDTWSGNCLKTRPESQIIQNILTKVGMWIHFWLHN